MSKFHICTLSEGFYEDYSNCSEILQKDNRPYIVLKIEIDGLIFAIPFRSNLPNNNIIPLSSCKTRGLDLNKTVLILKKEYINNSKNVIIEQSEYSKLTAEKYKIKSKLEKYIKDYKRKISNSKLRVTYRPDLEKMTLKYFHNELGIYDEPL